MPFGLCTSAVYLLCSSLFFFVGVLVPLSVVAPLFLDVLRGPLKTHRS